MLTFIFYILFLAFLYYGTKTVIKNALASDGLFLPDLEKLNFRWNLRWDPYSKQGRVKMRLFYYALYLPGVLFMFFLDLFLVFAAFYTVYNVIAG